MDLEEQFWSLFMEEYMLLPHIILSSSEHYYHYYCHSVEVQSRSQFVAAQKMQCVCFGVLTED